MGFDSFTCAFVSMMLMFMILYMGLFTCLELLFLIYLGMSI